MNEFLDKYSSKIPRINIPLSNFTFFHGASNEKKVDPKFIGREKIMAQLKSWLTNTDVETGVYLVTGFRGMGKSSFVGKVLHDITCTQSRALKYLTRIALFAIIIAFLSLFLGFSLNEYQWKFDNLKNLSWSKIFNYSSEGFYFPLFIYSLLIPIIIFIIDWWHYRKREGRRKIPIKLNLGHENLNEKNILSLISRSIEEQYNKYRKTISINRLVILMEIIFISFLSVFLSLFLLKNIGKVLYNTNFLEIQSILSELKKTSPPEDSLNYFFQIFVYLFSWGILYYMCRFFVTFINKHFDTPSAIEKQLKRLNERISSEIKEGGSSSAEIKKYIHFSFSRKKERNYPLADAREIELELTNILHRMSIKRWPLLPPPEFIIVFDELDKIEPLFHTDIKKDSIRHPEFEHVGSGFPGGEASRERKHTLLKMLANMKFFVSTAKTKFIFIASRELYDAFLADFSDREFAIGSIFSNVINVESFLSSNLSDKDMTQMTEQFICKQILPLYQQNYQDTASIKQWVKSKAKHKMLRQLVYMIVFLITNLNRFMIKVTENGKTIKISLSPFCNDYTNVSKVYLSYLTETEKTIKILLNLFCNDHTNVLKVYLSYLTKTEKLFSLNENQNYTFKTYNEFLQRYMLIATDKNHTESSINKVIIFLHQFSVYLAHISNGAPKKIAIHFEKYIKELNVKKTAASNNQDLLLPALCRKKKNNYYLSFGYRDQQKIGFIHYMAFPLMNAVFNNATQYGDKLLVSACFLTNHIYKYHNNGFSWRNLENIPEILDVNKTPELREFIHTIISFLKQSHLSSTISGLYNFKFPMKITEEISIMSKFSEEVSALFNFTLDDSLSVKRYYEKLLQHYTSINESIKNNTDNNNDLHHVIAGIHHILGDLHLFDEEYNKAIFEYQCCIQSLNKEPLDEQNFHSPSHILHVIRIMLKLALTHEKRKTYNSAYIVYNELISMLIKFRYIDESLFGLNYLQKIKDRNDAHFWHSKIDVLYNKKNNPANDDTRKFEKIIQPKVVTSTDYYKVEGGENTGLSAGFKYELEGQNMVSQFARHLTPEKYNVIVKLTLFEDVRLIYQAILAKLFLLEKKGLHGITKESLDTMESEFNFLHRTVNSEEKYIISADFFRKVADILFYKNGFINKHTTENYFMGWYLWDYSIENDIYNYCTIGNFNNYKTLLKLMNFKYNQSAKEYVLGELSENEVDVINEFINSPFFKIKIHNANWKTDQKKIFKFNYSENSSSITIKDSSTNNYSKIRKCNERRRLIIYSQENPNYRCLPCYACKYYNRSLKILLRNLMGEENPEHDFSKSLLIIKSIINKEKTRSLKETDLVVLAFCLDGLGNVLLSCSHEEDRISATFLDAFFKYIDTKKNNDFEELEKLGEFSHLEKAILYFWASAYYFKFSSNKKEASFCYKKILQLLVAYMSVHHKDKKRKEVFTKKRLGQIQKVIFSRAIQNLYSHYENTNIVEIQKIKWMLSKEMYEKIPLNLLSIFPDLEEKILAFAELDLLCDMEGEDIKGLYSSTFFSKNRFANTISERIISLKLKSTINMKIIDQLFKYEENLYNEDFPKTFFKNYRSYYSLGEKRSLDERLGIYKGIIKLDNEEDNHSTRIKFLEYLIQDTMFCLSKIIETISPSMKTTLFTDSYIASVYQLLFECNRLYEYIYMSYKWIEQQPEDKSMRKYLLEKTKHQTTIKNGEIESLLDSISKIKGLRNIIIEEKNYSENFFNTIFENIDKSNIHMNISNYLAEMALKKHLRASEMHREGAAYRELVSSMYFLDDDLNNDTCQFYLALERYMINCGFIDNKIANLRKMCAKSDLLKVDKYI